MTPSTASPSVCAIAIELSRARWVVGILLPGSVKVTTRTITGGDTTKLLDLLSKTRAQLNHDFGEPVALTVCYEAGYDGFWLARLLKNHGIQVYVLDASSFLISRRGRRTKTDRIDVEAVTFTLRAYVAGDPSVCRVVEIPSPETEDAKRLSRERTQLAAERTRHVQSVVCFRSMGFAR
jgi:transposase